MTKLIRKTQQPSDYPSNQIHDAYSTSTTDTYSCNYLNKARSEEYSTDEKKTNKIWIDNRPIYRRVVTGTVNGLNKTQDITTISNLRQILTIRGVMYSNFNQWWNIPNYFGEQGYTNSIYCDDNGNIKLEIGNFYGVGKPFIIILEYTKTTG